MKQSISALMDGELDDKVAGEAIDALARDRESLEAWRTYHLIGDALRESQPLPGGFSAPGRLQPQPRTWYALAASLAAVALVGWLGFAPEQTPAPLAKAPATARPVAQTRPVVVPLPQGTNDYLLAHQGFSPRVSLQGMAPYVRTVSEQGQEPRK